MKIFMGEVGFELLFEGWVESQQVEDWATGTVVRFKTQTGRACPKSSRQPGVGRMERDGGVRWGRW